MIPICYLTEQERYLLKKVEEDIPKIKSKKDLNLLENILDNLLIKAIKRYRNSKQ